jgi:hypothetical protein
MSESLEDYLTEKYMQGGATEAEARAAAGAAEKQILPVFTARPARGDNQ